MIRRPPRSTRTDTRFPYTTLFRSCVALCSISGTPCTVRKWDNHKDEGRPTGLVRSEEHTSELQSLMRISYADFCLKKKKTDASVIYHSKTTNGHSRKQHNDSNRCHTDIEAYHNVLIKKAHTS